jgi:hypothetical protein
MVNPLTCILPLKAGVNPLEVLGALAELNDKTQQALSAVGTVHFARFALLDASTPTLNPQLDGSGGPYKLAIITEYDGDFDRYIRDFAAYLPDVFGEILAVTEDWTEAPDLSTAHSVDVFVEYVRAHDLAQITPNQELSLFRAYSTPVADIPGAGGARRRRRGPVLGRRQ